MTAGATPVAAQDLGPPPRLVRRRRGWATIILARYVFTPGIALVLLWFVVAASVALWGTRTDGKILSIRQARVGNSTESFARYSFDFDGRAHTSEQRIEWQFHDLWKPGVTVNVRSANLFGWRYSTLADGLRDFRDLNVFAIYLALVLTLIGVPLAIAKGWVIPRRQERLLRDGAVAAATITDLPPGPNRSCIYEYADAAADTFTGSENVPNMVAPHLQIGDPLTIVYDPTRSARHLVYDFCDYTVVPRGADGA